MKFEIRNVRNGVVLIVDPDFIELAEPRQMPHILTIHGVTALSLKGTHHIML